MYTLKDILQNKSIVFESKKLTFLLLFRSFGNVIPNIAVNSNGFFSVSGSKNLGTCCKKRNKVL